jgi:hypothetical protein
MGYRLLADLTLIVHFCFILFVLFGGFLCLYHRYWLWLNLPAVVWGVWIEWSGGLCPLTPLENHFRRSATGSGYDTGFIEHYLLPIIYPLSLSVSLQLIFGLIVIIINILIYIYVTYKLVK